MRSSYFLRSCAVLALGFAGVASLTPSCSSSGGDGTGGHKTSSTGSGGSGGGGGAGGGGNVLLPGEICSDATGTIKLSASPPEIFVPTCKSGDSCTERTVRIAADPDACHKSAITFASTDKGAVLPEDTSIDLHQGSVDVVFHGGTSVGDSTVNATVTFKGDGGKTLGTATTSIVVHTMDATVPSCTGTAQTPALKGGDMVSLGAASISLPVGADKPNSGSFLWSVPPFAATLACGKDTVPAGYTALGPPITFGPVTQTFLREVPLAIPINPALMPSAAHLRHLRVAYSGPAFVAPRTVPIADPHIVKTSDGGWALQFKAPKLGTYQAVVSPDAGKKTFKRRMTHRAVMGISMGGGGTASFGFRHHDMFDVMAPLGGPVSWTWLLNYIETNHLGGFRPIAKGTTLKDIQLASTLCSSNADCKSDETCLGVLPDTTPPTQGKCVFLPKMTDPYAHAQTFNTWWYEYPKAGNGGTFSRRDYVQIFRDLAIMYGNPNGDNLAVNGENLPPGVPPLDPSVVGDHPGNECAITVDPIDGDPNESKQQELDQNCPAERCAHTLTLQNFFDDEYNPDGIFPVITVCDGDDQNQALTPYSNTWHSDGNGYPLEVGLAVDYNGNGVRDELEPIIRMGHEPWRDDGTDGIPSAQEAGYSVGVNEDPAGDDYNPQYNPTGTEGDHRYQTGEHFDDFGLDGVNNTKQQPATGYAHPGDGYDVGEGDGKFTVSRGLQRFWDRDAQGIVRQQVDPAQIPGGDMNDEAFSRIDLWTDGGTRDLFNFGVDAQHLVGAFSARGRDAVYYTTSVEAPGLNPQNLSFYDPSLIDYRDVPGAVLQRYGHIDPTQDDIDSGSGQHVGSAIELTSRLQGAFYYVGSRWKSHTELSYQVDDTPDAADPNAPECEQLGTCTINFTSKGGRTGPVGISLPPGYANKDLKNIRYPVIYLLHGYGQSPTDLEAAIVLLKNWMNNPVQSGANRLTKAIVVYVDGRCRTNPDGSSECIRGTFFADSPMKGGAQDETWWLELMQYMDQNYRTLPEDTVDWNE